jgi:hypothetical protein
MAHAVCNLFAKALRSFGHEIRQEGQMGQANVSFERSFGRKHDILRMLELAVPSNRAAPRDNT